MKKQQKRLPPALADWLIERIVGSQYLEEFTGDLHEIFEERLSERGKWYASSMYWIDVIHLVIGFSHTRTIKQSNGMMLRSILTMAWRNAIRQKQFTILNITGLTLGITTCLTIGLYIYDEITYDTFHEKADRIFRVNQPLIWGDWDEPFASTGPNVAEALRTDIPDLEQVTRILSNGEQTVRVPSGNVAAPVFTEERCFAAEDNFFKVFTFEFLSGNAATALNEPNGIVITQRTAKRYFGDEDAIGKFIEIKNDSTWASYTVRGVIADVPSRSHLQFDILVSLSSYANMLSFHGWKWIWTGFSTYVLVKEGTNIPDLTAKIQKLPPKWAAATTEQIFNQKFEEFTKGKPWTLYLQPLRKIYISGSPTSHRFGPTGQPSFVYIFGGVGVLVLILSCINFMNLSTARSTVRAKEVGVRKVLGSQRGILVRQFIIESLLYVAISAVLAFLVVHFSLNIFNGLAEKNIALLPHFLNPLFSAGILLFIVMLGIVAGSYPAFYLSSFQPAETLKGKIKAGFNRKGLRNGLVVFQFTVSITLIICTFFVQKQLTYTSTMDMGFDKTNILHIHKMEQLGPRFEALKDKLKTDPHFTQISFSYAIPPFVWEGERYKTPEAMNSIVDISNVRVDENYLTLLGVEFLAGRNFDPQRVTDKYKVILNEEAVKILGWGTKENFPKDSPIGKMVIQSFDREEKLEVIGVVKNFNFNSVRQKISPLMILHHQNDLFWNYGLGRSYLSLKLDPTSIKSGDDLNDLITTIKNKVAKIDSSVPFEYSFMDEDFDSTFRTEQRMSSVLNLFTVLAVIIACLGLFGLAAFSAEQRTKELGIRKVLGAKTHELVFVFSSEFTKLVVISVAIASPLAWYLVDSWLSNFSFRTPVEPWVFIIAAISALLIAMLTISYQSFKAANTNPVETLKSE